MKTHKTKPDCCPVCEDIHDAVSDLKGKAKPQAGDLSVCFNCGSINQYDENILMMKAEDSVLLDFASKQPDMFLDMQAFSHTIVTRGKIRRA